MTKVERYEIIRREHFLEGKSKRKISREQQVHRRDVRQAITSPIPLERKQPERQSPILGPHKEVIDRWLKGDQQVRRKQRHTSRRIWERLQAEEGFTGAESTVRKYVGRRRRELGLNVKEVFIEQEHQPGREAQVDFGEADVKLDGVMVTVHLLLVRCCYSGKTFTMAFRRQTQQAFLEGLVRALSYFGGVFEWLRFDNLKAAVKKVLRGRNRKETNRFVELRSHYLFKSVFCRPGKEGAPEKGGVEGEVGRFRRRHLVPVPEFADMDELNADLQRRCDEDNDRTMERRRETVGERWRVVQPKLDQLPAEPFDTTEMANPRVDNKSRAQVYRNFYSVPTVYAGRKVEAEISANSVVFKSGGETIAIHARRKGPFEESLVLDHYLEWLKVKPGALAGSKVLGQARRSGAFPPCYEMLWEELQDRYGSAEGTRQLIDVLMLLRDAPAEGVTMAVELALSHGCIDGQAVAYLLRQVLAPERQESELFLDLGPLSVYERAEPDISQYDAWLGVPTKQEVH